MKIFLAVFFGILAAVAVLGLVALGFNFYQDSMKTQALISEEPVMRVRTINAACITYASTYEHGYPEQLADMAPPADAGIDVDAHHAGLIDSVLATGTVDGYTFTYKTVRDSGSRMVNTYQIWASPQAGSDGSRRFYSDQTGIIRITYENRAATQNDLPVPE